MPGSGSARPGTVCLLWSRRARNAAKAQRISASASEKNSGAAEIAGFQREHHVALTCANRAQDRHAGSDFLADEEAGNAQAVDHRA